MNYLFWDKTFSLHYILAYNIFKIFSLLQIYFDMYDECFRLWFKRCEGIHGFLLLKELGEQDSLKTADMRDHARMTSTAWTQGKVFGGSGSRDHLPYIYMCTGESSDHLLCTCIQTGPNPTERMYNFYLWVLSDVSWKIW